MEDSLDVVLPREWIDGRRRWGCGKPKGVGQVMRQGQEPSLQVRRSQVVVMCVANRWLVDTCVMGVTSEDKCIHNDGQVIRPRRHDAKV